MPVVTDPVLESIIIIFGDKDDVLSQLSVKFLISTDGRGSIPL